MNNFSNLQVNYCSEACRSADFDLFHWAECGLIDRLQVKKLKECLVIQSLRVPFTMFSFSSTGPAERIGQRLCSKKVLQKNTSWTSNLRCATF